MSTLSSSSTNPVDGPAFAFGKQLPASDHLDDSAFLARVVWKPGAPRALKTMLSAENGSDGWADRLHAATGAASKPNLERVLWSRGAFGGPPRVELLAEALQSAAAASMGESAGKQARRAASNTWGLLREWIAEQAVSPAVGPVELLYVLELLKVPPAAGEAATYVSLWRVGLTSACTLSGLDEEPQGARAEADQRMLVLGELPWRLALAFANVKGAGAVRRRGAQVLAAGLQDRSDTDGMPHASLLPRFRLWLATFVRALRAADEYGEPLWNEEPQHRFRLLVRQATRLYQGERRCSLLEVAAGDGGAGESLSLMRQAAKLAGFRKQSPVRRYLHDLRPATNGAGSKLKRNTAQSGRSLSVQSDWAHLACLRDRLATDSNTVVVAHDQHPPRLELTCRGLPILRGDWNTAVTLDGEAVPLEGEWSCVCWHSDRGADYLELQLETKAGLRIDRQILFGWADEYVILADALSGAGPRRIDYRSHLPLAPGVEVKPRPETRALVLRHQKLRVRAMPTSLPDDRGISTPGGLQQHEDGLELKHASSGGGLYSSLVLDWSPARRREDAHWRQLTVSEGGRVLPAGRAAGQRLQIGKLHLLIYRSLDEADESRTVLGHHTLHETVIGRFSKSGEIEPILLVE